MPSENQQPQESTPSGLHVVIVTGLSGAGRSTALHALEDLGFFCVDNLPPNMAPRLVALVAEGRELDRVAFGMDVRTGAFLDGAERALDELSAAGHQVEVLFLDCADEALMRRFSETRRPHPLAHDSQDVEGEHVDVLSGIRRERERLGSLRARALQVIDTTTLSVHDLRRRLVDHIATGASPSRMLTRVVSFGFKYGLPVDADLVFDLRFLPNPHFVPELRPKTGREADVADFVLSSPEAKELMADLEPMLKRLLPRYEREGKSYLTIAIGCTGGKHRSVATAEALQKSLSAGGREVQVVHRDIERGRK